MLAIVGIGITIGVYGVVGLIVKMDDIGLHLAERRSAATRAIGRGLVKAMPALMDFVSIVGTAAMIWVGGGILVHGLEVLGVHEPAGTIHHAAEAAMHATGSLGGIAAWLVTRSPRACSACWSAACLRSACTRSGIDRARLFEA